MENSVYNYGFKYHNYTGEDEVNLQMWLRHNCKYVVYAHILGILAKPKIEGYLSLKRKMRMDSLKDKLLMAKISITELNNWGNVYERHGYFLKLDPRRYFEYGDITLVHNQDKTDKMEVAERLRNGFSIESIIAEYPLIYLEYGANIDKMGAIYSNRKKYMPPISLDDEIIEISATLLNKDESDDNAPPSGETNTPDENKLITQLPKNKEVTPPSSPDIYQHPKKRTYTDYLRPTVLLKRKKTTKSSHTHSIVIPETQEEYSGDDDKSIELIDK